MNNYINNINEKVLNNNNCYTQENEKINIISYGNKSNSTIINPYKINSLSSQKNLTQMMNGINDEIGDISSQIRNTDDKIENYINKNYSKNNKSKKNISLHKKKLPRPRSQAKKFLSINNSTISKIKRKKDNHTRTDSHQSDKISSHKDNSNDKSNGNSNNSTHNIITSNLNTNNITNYNLTNENSIFNKSLNNNNNKNPLKLSHSKLKKDSEEINKKLNSSYTENYISINNNFLNNNEKYLYRVPAKTKPKELILLNEVLQKQIIEVRLQLYDANKKIEDDANIIKNLKNDNNNLLEEKKCYENKINELVEIYNYDKNYNLNEMESQNKIIAQMDMEISQLNNTIKEKDELIQSLKEQINLMFLNKFENNDNDKSINVNGNININSNISSNNVNNNKTNKYSNYSITKLGTFKNYKIKTDINSLKEEFEQLINNKNICQNIKNLEDNYNGKTEGNKNTNYSPLESKEINEVNNPRKAKENTNQPNITKDNNINNKMKALIKENKKINDLYNKLKIEYENLTSNISDDFVKIKEENILLKKKLNEHKKAIEQLNKTNSDENVKILEYETEKQQNKIAKLKLENEITSLKEDKDKLSKLNKQINEINNELKLNNKELVKENNENLSQIKELKSIIDKNSKSNSNEGDKNENELKQKIKSLEENKLNLEKKIIEYENIIKELKEKSRVSNMGKEFNDNNNKIINENEKMKNEIISLKEQINKFKNDNRNNTTIENKLKEAEDKINLMKKENEKNLNELNAQQKKNQELIEKINNYKKNNIQNSIDIEGDEEEEEEYDNQVSSDSKVGRKPKNKKSEILELKNIINEKEKEIDKFKKINELLTKDNSIKEEKIKKLMNNLEVSQEQSYIKIIETLKQQIKENENTINNLNIKNKELNDLFNNNIPNSNKYMNKKKNKFEKAKLELRDDLENNNNYHSENRVDNSRLSRISGITSTSVGLTDQEKIDKYKKKMKEYKKEIENHLNQINVLKEEIRKLNHRLNSPVFQNFDEFINLFQIAFLDYKPNKKEQKEAYEQLNKKFGLFNISNF